MKDSLFSVGIQRFITLKGNMYRLAITTVIALTLINQAVIQFLLQKKNAYAHVVNLAGRQRMLSQKIVKLKYKSLYQPIDTNELKNLCTTWNAVHIGLQKGDESLGIPALENDDIQVLFNQLNPYQDQLCRLVLTFKEGQDPRGNLEIIDQNEEKFLGLMEQIVFQFEKSDIPFQNLILVELVLAIVALAIQVVEIVFIFTPMFIRLKKQNDSLIEIAHKQSHLVRSPVCTILGLVSLLNEEMLVDNSEVLKRLKASAEELKRVTSDIVEHSNNS